MTVRPSPRPTFGRPRRRRRRPRPRASRSPATSWPASHRSRRAADGAAGIDRAVGEPFIETGPSDRIGRPLGTIPRLTECWTASVTVHRQQEGRAAAASRWSSSSSRTTASVTSSSKGNWPIRQDEIQRRITIRPGRPLPPPGAERTAALEQERLRVLDFLRNEGYFEATVRLDARPGAKNPRAVDLYVDIDKGPSYPLGPVTFTGNHALSTEAIDLMFRHAAWYFAWLRPVPFTQKQVRLDIEALEKRYRDLGYFGVRVTTDFSMQKSLDRVAKNVRLAIQINEREEDQRRVRG